MVNRLEAKIKALEAFSFEREVIDIVQTNKDKLADLQATQLFSGKRSDGSDINPQYAPFTIEQKKKKGQPYDRVTFRDTGELYRSFFADVNNKTFSIKSDNFKFDKMIKRSGVKTVGLNIDSRRTFVDEITHPEIIRRYEEKVGRV